MMWHSQVSQRFNKLYVIFSDPFSYNRFRLFSNSVIKTDIFARNLNTNANYDKL